MSGTKKINSENKHRVLNNKISNMIKINSNPANFICAPFKTVVQVILYAECKDALILELKQVLCVDSS